MTVASAVAYSDPGATSVLTRTTTVPRPTETVQRTATNVENVSRISVPDQQETSVDLESLQKAAEQIQAAAALVDVQLQFRIDSETNRVQMVITNPETDEVVAEIPPSDVLKAASRLKEIIGLLIDTTA
jgi:uncharacterized FlaG/YvyC family protein